MRYRIFKEKNKEADYKQFIRGTDYLTEYNQMRWDVLEDPDGYNDMTPEEILKDLFSEK